jgi:hypothetical protein
MDGQQHDFRRRYDIICLTVRPHLTEQPDVLRQHLPADPSPCDGDLGSMRHRLPASAPTFGEPTTRALRYVIGQAKVVTGSRT